MSDRRFSDRDLERNEDPEKIGGAVIGSTGAGIVGGIGLAALGPLGAIAGALAGAAGGWWAGKGVVRAVDDMDRADNEFRRAHEHAGATRPYDEVRHGYQLGYLAGRNPDYAAVEFSEVENDLRTAWVQAHRQDEHPVRWEDVRADARTGYELARKES
ncbi:MAG: hypothetical protein ACRELX_03725 [Longimicrobiales bacterium]